MSRYVTESESCDWSRVTLASVYVCVGVRVSVAVVISDYCRRGEQSDLSAWYVDLHPLFLFDNLFHFLIEVFILSTPRRPPRQCHVLSSAIPGHHPQTFFNSSRSLPMGTSNSPLWTPSHLSRLPPLYKWEYTTPHAVHSPSPKLHLTLSIPTLK